MNRTDLILLVVALLATLVGMAIIAVKRWA